MSDNEQPGKNFAPWTEEEVKNLNDFQVCGRFHPYTSREKSIPLIATKEGWVEVEGGLVVQNWAYKFSVTGYLEDFDQLFKKDNEEK